MKQQGITKILIIVVIVLVLVLIGGGVFGFIMYNKMTKEEVKPKIEKTHVMDEVIVNLADEYETFIKCKIALGYTSEELDSEIAEKTPKLRDYLITYLRTKKAEDFNGNKLEDIKADLINNFNKQLEKGKIERIYFQDIIIQ